MRRSQATKTRPLARAGRKAARIPAPTRLVVGGALRGWVVPIVAVVTGFLAFVLYSASVLREPAAVTTVGMAALLLVLYYGLHNFLQHDLDRGTTATLVIFAVLWTASSGYFFYRAVNPGAPLYSTELVRKGPPVSLPFHGKPGHYSLAIEGHFLPAEGHVNRTAAYKLVLSHDGTRDRVIQGAFSQTWSTQRVGSGRRSSLVPSMREMTLVREAVDNPSGNDLTLQLTNLSPGVRNGITVRLYGGGAPQWVLVAISLLALAGASVVDAWRPKGVNEGLMTAMTVAVIAGVGIFRASSPATPGFPQFAVAALMGTLAGALGGSLLWRLTQPLRRRLAPSH
jgi:hypothetical protein